MMTCSDANEYGDIVEKLVGQKCERSLAVNSIKLRFGTESDPRGRQYIWIDPPWQFTRNGEIITTSLEYSEEQFKQWSGLFAPLDATVLEGWYAAADGATHFCFSDGYQLIVPLNEPPRDDDDWYYHWYARDRETERASAADG